VDYFGILKRAYEITIKHRYLWIFGILAGGLGTSWNFSLPNSSSYSGNMEKFFTSQNQLQMENFWLNYWGVIVAVLGIFFLLGILWLVISVIAQGGLLGSVTGIAKGEKNDFRLGFHFGLKKFWRTLSVGLLIGLLVLLSLIVLGLPVILLVLGKIYVLAIIYGILIFFADLILWLYLGAMQPYIVRRAVLDDTGAWEAILTSWDFLKKNFLEILVIYLLLMALGIALGIGMILALILVGGLLFAIGFALYLASQIVFWFYVVVFGLAFVVFFLILGGIFNTFHSSVLTLTYLELTKKP